MYRGRTVKQRLVKFLRHQTLGCESLAKNVGIADGAVWSVMVGECLTFIGIHHFPNVQQPLFVPKAR